MPTFTLTDEQVVQLFQQLRPERQLSALLALAKTARGDESARRAKAEMRLRDLAAQRGKAWDSMDERQRQDFIDDLIHEDRECGR